MDRALELAERALGSCSPNPAVGAVLVQRGRVVGEGFTQPPGGPHAEIVALRQAGPNAAGAVLFVTLEPCSHQGRTPPCTDALIQAGVAEVRAATPDPSPWVDGAGTRALEQAGIRVQVGDRERAARRLNEAYFKWVRTGLPFVTLKYAMTIDGKIATRTGNSRWVTGPEARLRVARWRSQVDAVLVGIGTVLADDPQLTARPAGGEERPEPVHQPLRVILDSSGRLPLTSRVLDPSLPAKTLVCITERATQTWRNEVEARGGEVAVLPGSEQGVDVRAACELLGGRQIVSVLVEAGGAVAASFLAASCVDKVLAFVAPKIVGGRDAPTPVEGDGVAEMEDALVLREPEWLLLGQDALLSGYLAEPDPDPAGSS